MESYSICLCDCLVSLSIMSSEFIPAVVYTGFPSVRRLNDILESLVLLAGWVWLSDREGNKHLAGLHAAAAVTVGLGVGIRSEEASALYEVHVYLPPGVKCGREPGLLLLRSLGKTAFASSDLWRHKWVGLGKILSQGLRATGLPQRASAIPPVSVASFGGFVDIQNRLKCYTDSEELIWERLSQRGNNRKVICV